LSRGPPLPSSSLCRARRPPPPPQGWRETIRFIPPLVVSEYEIETALAMFERGLQDAIKGLRRG
jgi:hypothetical protein